MCIVCMYDTSAIKFNHFVSAICMYGEKAVFFFSCEHIVANKSVQRTTPQLLKSTILFLSAHIYHPLGVNISTVGL